jgi:hypothetical protein
LFNVFFTTNVVATAAATFCAYSCRADRLGIEWKSGEFVAVIDMAGLTYKSYPSMAFMKQGIYLLKNHYPHRLAAAYIVNAGEPFKYMWQVLRPLLPAKAVEKTYVLSSGAEATEVLRTQLGEACLERQYGGSLPEQFHPDTSTDTDVSDYFANGFWRPSNSSHGQGLP